MENIKREIDLQLDPPLYPWQLVDGDGVEWVIIRRKMQLPNENITELGELVLEDNSFELLEGAEGGKWLYRGNLRLQAYYKCMKQDELDLVYQEAVYDEHQAREQLGCSKESTLWQKQPDGETIVGSAFLSQVYEELVTVPPAETSAMSIWQVEMPWQVWLEGGKIMGQPEIIIAQLGQIGMRTILCEVLLHLRAQEREEMESTPLGIHSFLGGEEVVLNSPRGRIGEVLGSAIRRAFYQVKPVKSKTLALEYLTKVNLVYLSAEPGGERILTAWGLVPETLNLPVSEPPVLAPFIAKLKSEKLTLVRINERKVLLKEQFVVTLGEGNQIIIPKQQIISPSVLEKPIAATTLDSDPQKLAYIRPRPGEKWQVKKTNSTNSSYCQKKVLAIKFSTR